MMRRADRVSEPLPAARPRAIGQNNTGASLAPQTWPKLRRRRTGRVAVGALVACRTAARARPGGSCDSTAVRTTSRGSSIGRTGRASTLQETAQATKQMTAATRSIKATTPACV